MEFRNGKYRESIIMPGNIKITGPSFSRKTDATAWKSKMIAERAKMKLHGEEYKIQEKTTFKEYSSRWLNELIRPFKSPSTTKDFELILRCHLYPVIGEIQLKEIKIKDAEKIMASLRAKGKGPKRIVDIVTLLKQILNEAERKEDILKNPLRHLKFQKVPETALNYWQDLEINQFLVHSRSHEYYPFFVTAFYTGMRKGEIAALTWDCIDFNSNLITVKGTLDKFGHRQMTKTGKIRYVPINPFLKSVLIDVFKQRTENSPYVFLSKGNPIDTNHLYRVFGKLQKSAGIHKKIRVHDTRHTFASMFMMKGLGSLYDLSSILGHSDTKMTQRYAHLSPNHLSKATLNLKFGMEKELSGEVTPNLPQAILGPTVLNYAVPV